MKIIKLTYNQSKKLIHDNEEITVKQNGLVLYLSYYEDGIIAKNWTGKTEKNIIIKLDENWEV